MTAIGNRRSTILVYSDADALSWAGLNSHRVRVMLGEKDLSTEIVQITPGDANESLLRQNPHGTCPTLVDRELALYGERVILDYLDERYPHPPFMPVDPVSRARTRLALYRIESDWYSLLPCAPHQAMSVDEATVTLSETLTASSGVFAAMPFFLSEEYSILDATLAPLLWRLPAYGIVLPESASAVEEYAQRLFARLGFQSSLSDMERDMVK